MWDDPATWDVGDFAQENPNEPVRPFAALVSFHFLRAAVRRRLTLCLLTGLVGMLLGGAFLLVAPGTHSARSTLVLAHDPLVDPSRAMATDVGLLATRTVAERAISDLQISLDPQDLLDSVTAVPPTSDVLELTMSAPTDDEAVRRLDAFTAAYLEFRATQVSAQSDALLQGYADRISAAQDQVNELSKRITALSRAGAAGQDQLGETITKRAQLQNQISSVEESAQDVTLRRTALMAASRVIDPATVQPASAPKRIALALASGLIGGAALAVGGVVLQSILSDRLRLRLEVSSALEVPVTLSVGRLRPLPRMLRGLRFLPSVRRRGDRRAADLQRVAHAIERALPEPGHRQRLALACVENADEVRIGLAAAAVALQQRGRAVDLVDLSEGGGLESAVAQLMPGNAEDRPVVHRPSVIPSLCAGPADLDATEAPELLSLGDTGVCLVLADLDPRVGADHLTAWTERVMVAVTSGKSGVDRIRTTGDLIRAAGLEFPSALLIHALDDDASPGIRPAQSAGRMSRTADSNDDGGAETPSATESVPS